MHATPAQDTRRRFERVPFFCRVVVTAAAKHGPPLEGRSVDISLGGVGLCAPRGVPARRACAISLAWQAAVASV